MGYLLLILQLENGENQELDSVEFGCLRVVVCWGGFVFTGTCLLLCFYNAWCHMYHNRKIKVVLSGLLERHALQSASSLKKITSSLQCTLAIFKI